MVPSHDNRVLSVLFTGSGGNDDAGRKLENSKEMMVIRKDQAYKNCFNITRSCSRIRGRIKCDTDSGKYGTSGLPP
jgi:hypothetical protein